MHTAQKTIRVLVVDDSKIAQRAFSKILDADPEIEVVGTASDPYIARDRVVELDPDVLTLDVEMPRMDGITFLGKLMRFRPKPVVVVSSITPKGGEVAMRAFSAGAVEVLCKPSGLYALDRMSADLLHHVKAAAAVKNLGGSSSRSVPTRSVLHRATRDLVALGASTGGPEALRTVLSGFPVNTPPVVVVQHIPPQYSGALAASLDHATSLEVLEAQDGQVLQTGHAYITPGDQHAEVRGGNGKYTIRLHDDPPVNLHRPSVDVMMDSVARVAGQRAVGAILTGMGADGAEGLKNMRSAGARTIAQDESTCVVYGMPREALENGGAERAVPLVDLPEALIQMLQS